LGRESTSAYLPLPNPAKTRGEERHGVKGGCCIPFLAQGIVNESMGGRGGSPFAVEKRFVKQMLSSISPAKKEDKWGIGHPIARTKEGGNQVLTVY